MVYRKIKKLCEKEGISIAALERSCGLGNATIRAWDEGSPRVDRLKPVADYFGVTIDELIRDDAV